jgi:septum formation protein
MNIANYNKKIILASASPRRKKILETLNFEFEVLPSEFDENLENNYYTPAKIINLAYNKAIEIAQYLDDEVLVIGADTVVVLNNKILGKPKNKKDAFNMLKSLSGQKHIVVTAVCIVNSKNLTFKSNITTSTVEFNELSDDLINEYIQTYKPFDKAGSYGIQELDERFIKNIEGSLENIIGLDSGSLIKLIEIF